MHGAGHASDCHMTISPLPYRPGCHHVTVTFRQEKLATPGHTSVVLSPPVTRCNQCLNCTSCHPMAGHCTHHCVAVANTVVV
jgi:hypothetical protein